MELGWCECDHGITHEVRDAVIWNTLVRYGAVKDLTTLQMPVPGVPGPEVLHRSWLLRFSGLFRFRTFRVQRNAQDSLFTSPAECLLWSPVLQSSSKIASVWLTQVPRVHSAEPRERSSDNEMENGWRALFDKLQTGCEGGKLNLNVLLWGSAPLRLTTTTYHIFKTCGHGITINEHL